MRDKSVDRGWIFEQCANNSALSSGEFISTFVQLVRDAGFAVYASTEHKFPGAGGITAVVIIGESSVDIHTWPEAHAAHVRLFYCRSSAEDDVRAELLVSSVKEHLQPERIRELPAREFPV